MDDDRAIVTESGLIDAIRAREEERRRSASRPAPPSGGWARLGIGDDCAILEIEAGAEQLITTDMLMDGRHFRLERDGAEAVGRKALAVNLSDIAAMAGVPRAAVVAVALPRGGPIEAAAIGRGIYEGISALAERFGVELVGGDTNAWDGPLVIAITVLGQATERGAVRRSGARPGDLVFVTGPLGGSLGFGRHLRPEPRIAEALAIHERVSIHAMIDLSDGLSSDLAHILKESGGPGAIIDADAVPIHADARTMAERDGVSPLDHALHDGEDFELCLTVAPEQAERLLNDLPASVVLHRVGEITAAPGLFLRDERGPVPIERRGFDHFRNG